MRKWMLDEESAGDSSDNEYYEILELYHERKAYVTNRHTRRCTVYRIEHPFYHHDISPNATFTGYETLGSYPDQLTLTQWFDPRYSFEYAPAVRYQTFTHDCVPVRDDKMGDSFGFVYEEFADVTIGRTQVVRQPGVKKIQRDRYKDEGLVQQIMDADLAWRQTAFKRDLYSKVKNATAKTVGAKMKAKEAVGDSDALPANITTALMDDPKALTAEVLGGLTVTQLRKLSGFIDEARKTVEQQAAELEAQRDELLRSVGNVLHPSVPISDNEDNNLILRTVGDAAVNQTRKEYSHVDLITMIDGVDTQRGTVAAGSRCYYLKGAAVALEQALCAFSVQFLMDRGFTALSPPLFMRKEVMQEVRTLEFCLVATRVMCHTDRFRMFLRTQVAQLSQFNEELYKVTGKASERAEDAEVEEKYLIATAEQPIAAFHRNEWINPEELPLRYVGVSECFRQEVGSHGRDTLGIFRVHQFKKIEQFVICSPHDDISWKLMDEMLANAEDFLKAIGLPYQVVSIVSGALNLAAAKKNDVEAWFPGSGAFRELVSCSNCTDYQARRLKIRYGQTKKLNARTDYVHMLNSTLCATTRNVCCILENFQVGNFSNGGGVVVPEVLRPYMPSQYREFIPFVKPAPIDVERAAAEAKGSLRTVVTGSASNVSGGSGYADHSAGLSIDPAIKGYRVPLVRGTEANLQGYATMFPASKEDFDAAKVDIAQWPQLPGRRPICESSGRAGGVREGLFTFAWHDRELLAINEAVGGNYTTGVIPTCLSATPRTECVTREANYHPDGGQIVCPRDGQAYVALLALPKDNVRPEDFVAFYCDGTFGIHINTDVWHQPVYPIGEEAVFYGKQGAVHACAAYDSVDEHDTWLRVPLEAQDCLEEMPAHLRP
ncbi:uncharacterized protein MONBRDRAFT_37346 [Monosiga brevicollis MX1]|uniref:serine--tRNA ligase n=1 Tax=Monosiga brevicollis TaxID=81824 RepID=A9V151_MONBE|nr:uncharacterized protein MONBRDRAFT_37346 [Monosiga brevicollis MX1]EDQ88746.1 predicted protein [Monosiga brevicollis MX1]|eukprot:XP_001746359.1 hypothetical protein [Monosiga brevicollis MX1]